MHFVSVAPFATAAAFALCASSASAAPITFSNAFGSTVASPLHKRADGYKDPKSGGGSSLGLFPDNASGEPLNVIVSGKSSAEILSEDGFKAWYNAIGFNRECFGIHSGTKMQANLGDGQGLHDQQDEVRESYGEDTTSGSCFESLVGGNHFRYWQQAGTNAWFLAASVEKDVSQKHDVVEDGYNKGRDEIVGLATQGADSDDGKHYAATVKYVTGLLPTGTNGINHGDEGVGVDGKTAVITVTVS
ncbi:hypothetical protein CBOM_03838 [Ceraceosorus bombacis]|uniref:Uncharacterized protein n=1 Tax=Ceraceosorus bombacis TaxID=401625 RepID=A0A0N7LA42_9BASI|nr:hypothetical protein CBOM_03838 [Ceraceosorus bombacis]